MIVADKPSPRCPRGCSPRRLLPRPLSYALLKNIVPDFPLCNKSFNQSYSGNDL
jgi:hypothetical protein